MRTTNHALEPEELMAYLDGELPSDIAARVAGHLESCRECQETVSDLRSVSGRLMEWRVETPPMIAPQGRVQVQTLPLYRRRLVWVVAAACLLPVAILVSPAFYRSTERVERQTRMQLAQNGGDFVEAPARPLVHSAAAREIPAPSGTPGPAPLIAHTARLNLVANNFDRSRDALQQILTRHHGYIAELTINAEESSARTLEASVKTPSNQLDATMAEIKALGRVVSESRGGEEVTQQSIDLDARLANARNTEERLTDLLKHRTDKLGDILAVEDQISQTRGQIEQMEAERKNLNNRVEYAKLDVHISEEYKAQLDGNRTSTSTQLRNAAVEGFSAVTANLLGLVMFLLSYGPIALVWCAILFFPMRYAWRRIVRG